MSRPYIFPLLLAEKQSLTAERDYRCRGAINAAWRDGRPAHAGASIKAARDALSFQDLTPANLNAIVWALVAYDDQPWPMNKDEADRPVDWMYYGDGGSERRGTYRDTRVAVRYAIMAALSILLEVPIEHASDEATLLQTLIRTGWAVPSHQQQRVARRVTRYVDNKVRGRPFTPVREGCRL